MRIDGALFLAASWLIIIALNIYCFWKVFNVRKF